MSPLRKEGGRFPARNGGVPGVINFGIAGPPSFLRGLAVPARLGWGRRGLGLGGTGSVVGSCLRPPALVNQSLPFAELLRRPVRALLRTMVGEAGTLAVKMRHSEKLSALSDGRQFRVSLPAASAFVLFGLV